MRSDTSDIVRINFLKFVPYSAYDCTTIYVSRYEPVKSCSFNGKSKSQQAPLKSCSLALRSSSGWSFLSLSMHTVSEFHCLLQELYPMNHHSSQEDAIKGTSCLLLAFLNPTICHLFKSKISKLDLISISS